MYLKANISDNGIQEPKIARKTEIVGRGFFEKVGFEMSPEGLVEFKLEDRSGGKWVW